MVRARMPGGVGGKAREGLPIPIFRVHKKVIYNPQTSGKLPNVMTMGAYLRRPCSQSSLYKIFFILYA